MSERIAAGEIFTSTVTGGRIGTDALPNSSRKKGVRQWNESASPPPSLADLSSRPAHPSNRLVAQLNANWRVIDDPLQWILQRRKRTQRSKNTGWECRSYCRTREALLRRVREYCCLPGRGTLRRIHQYRGVDGAALRQIRALPEWHVDWEKRLDPNGSAFDHTTAEMPQ